MRYLFFFGGLLIAQPLTEICNDPQIYTIQLYRGNNPLSFAYLGLGESQSLFLEFDEVFAQAPSEFWVRVRLCDKAWNPVDLPPSEYWKGFISERITQFQPSQATRISYIHYTYLVPNLAKYSGNYVLEVFRGADLAHLAFRKRFYVVENLVRFEVDRESMPQTSTRLRFQSLAFRLHPGRLPLTNALQEISVCILQNGRWDNARCNLQPTYLHPTYLEYRFQPGLDLPAGNEFRLLDLRTVLRRRSFQVERTIWSDSGVVVLLVPETPRSRGSYMSTYDLNGRFFTQNQDFPLDTAGKWTGNPLSAATLADYLWVEFRLDSDKLNDAVYCIGSFMNWSPDPRFRMVYDVQRYRYVCRVLLKQGVYDYMYAVWDEKELAFDITPIEGSFFEAENTYLLLAYYRGFTDRHDRLVGHRWLGTYE